MLREIPRSRQFVVAAAEVLLAGAVTFNLTSCSILLPMSAAQTNHRWPKGDLEVSRVGELPAHPEIRILTVQGDTLEAIFSGIAMLPEDRYRPRYEAWRGSGNEDQPALNEKVTLIPRKGRRIQGTFLGFGIKSVWVHQGRQGDSEYPLESLRAIQLASGTEPRLDSLVTRAKRNQLPSRVGARLRFPSQVPAEFERYREEKKWMALVPVDDVQAVIIDGSVASPVAAFAAGVGLDAIMLMVLAAGAMSNSGGCDYDASGITFGSPY